MMLLARNQPRWEVRSKQLDIHRFGWKTIEIRELIRSSTHHCWFHQSRGMMIPNDVIFFQAGHHQHLRRWCSWIFPAPGDSWNDCAWGCENGHGLRNQIWGTDMQKAGHIWIYLVERSWKSQTISNPAILGVTIFWGHTQMIRVWPFLTRPRPKTRGTCVSPDSLWWGPIFPYSQLTRQTPSSGSKLSAGASKVCRSILTSCKVLSRQSCF